MTTTEVAKVFGVHPSTVLRWEREGVLRESLCRQLKTGVRPPRNVRQPPHHLGGVLMRTDVDAHKAGHV